VSLDVGLSLAGGGSINNWNYTGNNLTRVGGEAWWRNVRPTARIVSYGNNDNISFTEVLGVQGHFITDFYTGVLISP
jgi:hypothetical protein